MVLIAIIAAFVGLGAIGVASAAAPPRSHPRVGPAGLRFYTPPSRLPSGSHGTLVWERSYHGPAALTGAVNTLLLYTQVGIHGKLVATSGYLAVPNGKPPKGGWPVVTWAHGSTGIADQCAPTRYANSHDAVTNGPLLQRWLSDGYAVVRTDYEGLGTPGPHPYLIGRSEGRAVLDVVRAARQFDPVLSDRVIIAGHSQGGQAALWAASLAPTYTPDLGLRGTVAFAPQSHTAVTISAIRSLNATGKAGTIALILRGVDIANPSLHVRSLLTPAAARLFLQTLTTCLAKLNSPSSFGSLAYDQLIAPTANLTGLLAALNRNDPQQLKIRGPVLIEQGLADTTVFPAFDQELEQSLIKHGDHVTYHTHPGVTHATIINAASNDATTFLHRRFGSY